MHPHSAAEDTVLGLSHYATEALIEVCETMLGTYLLLQSQIGVNPFLSATISADLDQLVQAADIRLDLGTGIRNLSPLYSTGARFASGRSLCDVGVFIKISTRCRSDAAGAPPLSILPFRPVFHGRIDGADPAADAANVLSLRCRCIQSEVLDTWITEPKPIAAMPIKDLLVTLMVQGVINTTPEGQPWPFSILGSPTASGLATTAYTQEPGSVLLAMRQHSMQNGWDLRGKWGSRGTFGTGPSNTDDTYVLTYYEPDRALADTARAYVTPNRYFELRSLATSRDEIRNLVVIVPANERANPGIAFDNTSRVKYGYRFMQVSEDATSHVLTNVDAKRLADTILSDTKDPKTQAEVVTPYLPFLEVNDLIQLGPNGVHHNLPIVMAISGFTHTLMENGHAETTLRTRVRPAAANREWRRIEPKTAFVSTVAPAGFAPEGSTYAHLT